jgi:hypothetical protein
LFASRSKARELSESSSGGGNIGGNEGSTMDGLVPGSRQRIETGLFQPPPPPLPLVTGSRPLGRSAGPPAPLMFGAPAVAAGKHRPFGPPGPPVRHPLAANNGPLMQF